MPLPDDIGKTANAVFFGVDREAAPALLRNAPIVDTHDGPRLLRCTQVASDGSIAKLEHYVALLALDPRDVIRAGEYELIEGKLTRVRDLGSPFISR